MNAPPETAETSAALDLTVALAADGRSRLASRHVHFPWSLGRGYPGPTGEPVTLIPQVAGAGLLAGDHVAQRINVRTGAALDLVSAGAMLTYGTSGGDSSTSAWNVAVAGQSTATLLSEPYVLMDDANLKLEQVFTVAGDATLIACEGVVCLGARVRWQSETIVGRPDGATLFIDRQMASPEVLETQAALPGKWSAFGTVLVVTPDPARVLENMARAAQRSPDSTWFAAALTPRDSGACIRIAAPDGQSLRAALRNIVPSVSDAQAGFPSQMEEN